MWLGADCVRVHSSSLPLSFATNIPKWDRREEVNKKKKTTHQHTCIHILVRYIDVTKENSLFC